MRLLFKFNAILVLFLVSFGSFALKIVPAQPHMYEGDSLPSFSIENMQPIDEISKELFPQLIVARIIGSYFYYDYDAMPVYLAEYDGIRFVIYPNEKDSIWEKYNLPEIEKETPEKTLQQMSNEDIFRFLLERSNDKELMDSLGYDFSDFGKSETRPIMATLPIPPVKGLNFSPIKKYVPWKEVKYGELYFFVVEPSIFRETGLRTAHMPFTIDIIEALKDAKYCFKALNIKRDKIYPITGEFFQK